MTLPDNGEPVEKALTAEQKIARFNKLNAFLVAKRLSTRSADGYIDVVTDGFGEIISLSVEPSALDDPRVTNLGRAVVETIDEARKRAEWLRAAGRAKMFPGASEVSS